MKEVVFRLRAINDDFRRGMTQAGDSVADFAKVSGAASLAAGAALGAFVLKAAADTDEYGRSILKLSRVSGESVETASKLAFAAQQTGISTDRLAFGIKFLEKNMAAANPEFAKLGVNVKDQNGSLRSSHAVLLDVADSFAHTSDGAEKTAAAIKLFGRGGEQMIPMLNLGRQGLLDLEAAAEKYGLVLTQDNMAAIKANIQAHREFDAALMGAKVRIGEEVLPALTVLTEGFAKLPGPVAGAIVPVTGLLLAYGGIVTIGPKVVDAIKAITAGTTAMSAAISGGALLAIGLILKGMDDIQKASHDTQVALSGSIDWTNHDKATQSLNNELAAVNRLGDEWNNMSPPEKLLHPEKWKIYADAQAQAEEDLKHFNDQTARLSTLANVLGVTGDKAKEMAAATHADLSTIDPAKYTPIFRALAAGTISAAEATAQLTAAQRASGATAAEQADHIKELTDETKQQNDAEKAVFSSQYAFIDAQNKLTAAQKGVEQANRDVTRAQQERVRAGQTVEAAERRHTEAAQRVTDAIRAQRDAQRALNDLLAGPTQNEQLNIESARIALLEAQRRAQGITTTDPELERRKNALEVARAQQALEEAEGAHAKNVELAQAAVETANKAVTDAQQAEKDAAQGVTDANAALGEFDQKVADAQQKAADATLAVGQANIDLDTAARNLELSFATGATSMDLNKEALDRWVAQGRITKDQADLIKKAMDDAKTAADALATGAPPAPAPAVSGRKFEELSPEEQDALRRAAAGFQGGGYLTEGWNLVGEAGPEAIWKQGARVRVSTASATAGLLAAGGAGGYTHNGDIIIGTATERTAADIVWEQRRLALSVAR